jgi:hypothetical protein
MGPASAVALDVVVAGELGAAATDLEPPQPDRTEADNTPVRASELRKEARAPNRQNELMGDFLR